LMQRGEKRLGRSGRLDCAVQYRLRELTPFRSPASEERLQ
jgi:hypothetical protein